MKTKHITETPARRLCILVGIVSFLAGIAVAISTGPRAESILDGKTTFDLGAGECRYTASPPGQWWQPEFQHSIRTVDNCQSIGFSFALARSWTVGIHYASLGSVAIDATAVTCRADDCEKNRDYAKDFYRPECLKWNEDNCAYRWTSGGNAKGALATAAYRVFDMGALGFDLRGGLYFHQLKYAAAVENFGCPDMASCRQLTVTQKTHFDVRPVLGISAKYKPGFLHGGFVAVTWDRFFGIGNRVDQFTGGFKGDTDRLMFWTGLPL
jgi:hypothetical protein